jgi:hypothetical protein
VVRTVSFFSFALSECLLVLSSSFLSPSSCYLHLRFFVCSSLISVVFFVLFVVLITLDCIITQNDALSSSWSAYKSMVAFSRADPESFQTNPEEIIKFEALLVSIDQKVSSWVTFPLFHWIILLLLFLKFLLCFWFCCVSTTFFIGLAWLIWSSRSFRV